MEVSGRTDGKGEPPEEDGRERIMETRLILSRDFGPLNIAFDWINETDMRRGGFTDFGYALGLRWALSDHHHHAGVARSRWRPAAIGLELFGGLGNNRAFVGTAFGLSGVSHDLIRTGVALEF